MRNLSQGAMENISEPGFLLVFGFISIPQRYKVGKDVIMTLVALMSFVGIIANGILMLVIIKDPYKQLRTITAILLAYNSATNLINSTMLFLDNVFYWSNTLLPPELILYFGIFTTFSYVVGNLLHTVNTYGAVVYPVRYAILAPKLRRYLVQSLVIIWVVLAAAIFIPTYTLPKGKGYSYVQGMLTMVCALLALLAITFVYFYSKIFKKLYSRRRRLSLSFHLRRATVKDRALDKNDHNIVKTLLAQVLLFMITTVVGSVIFLAFLHCRSCDPVKLQLAALASIPITYAPLVCLPFLWLFRLSQYKKAMIKTLRIWRCSRSHFRRSKTWRVNNQDGETRLATLHNRSGSGSNDQDESGTKELYV